ncbi:MAG: hypothetical protein IT416_02070 [Candidatus Pacebacteria bacterium]|nr:hypothetical protein [Candidatus Paceibacterota bacterium]
MSEVLRPEVIRPKKTTLSDKVISWMCDHWQKIKPGNFRDRKNIVVDETGTGPQPREVEEQNLEVVADVVSLYENSRETGKIVNKEKNPLGENLRDLMMVFIGDTHLPGGNLEEEVYEKNEPYIFLKKVRAVLLGIKREVKREIEVAREVQPSEFLAIKTAIKNLKDRLVVSYKTLVSGDNQAINQLKIKLAGEIDILRAEIREADGIDAYNSFNALKNAIVRTVKTATDSSDPANSPQLLLAHVGDNISNEQKMGDVAFSAAQLEAERNELEQETGLKTVLTKAQGNHDTDLINYGLEHDAFDRLLFGSQVFSQEIGDDLVVLSLNTNFYSTFWHQHLERRKVALQRRLDQVAGLVGESEDKAKLQAINERELASLAEIRAEMLKQVQIVEAAKKSGKRIILIGHEQGYLLQTLGQKIKKSTVVGVVSGHDHRHKYVQQKNKHGETIHYLNVGSDSGFALRIRDINNRLEIVVQEVIPTAKDYQNALEVM